MRPFMGVVNREGMTVFIVQHRHCYSTIGSSAIANDGGNSSSLEGALCERGFVFILVR